MKVFYVTSAIPGSVVKDDAAVHRALIEQARTGQPMRAQMQRIEIAKFFEREHAEAHVATLSASHLDVEIEEREETVEQQHEAHRDIVATRVAALEASLAEQKRAQTARLAERAAAPPPESIAPRASDHATPTVEAPVATTGPVEDHAADVVAEMSAPPGDKSAEVQTLIDEAAKPR